MIDTKELRRLAQAATPGPWINHGRQLNVAGLPHSAVAAKTLLARVYSEAYGDVEQETANASFIAAANPAAITELLDRLEAAENDSARHKALAESALRVAKGWEDKCNDLRAKVEAMERQEPVDLNYIELMNSAQKIVESYVYFRRFIASTPLENDIAVWMADFVFAQLGAKGE